MLVKDVQAESNFSLHVKDACQMLGFPTNNGRKFQAKELTKTSVNSYRVHMTEIHALELSNQLRILDMK